MPKKTYMQPSKSEIIQEIRTRAVTFVASFSIVQHPETGHFMTYCVWPRGVLSLLPQTDTIAFMQDGKAPLMVPWDRTVEVVGDLMTPLDIYPQRFQVSEFPTEEQLAAMGCPC